MRSFGSLVVLSCLSLSACIVTINDEGDEESSSSGSSGTNEDSTTTATTDTGDDTGSTSGGDGDSATSGGDGDASTTSGGDGDSSTTSGGDGDSDTTTGGDGDSGTTTGGDGDGDQGCTADGMAVVAAINAARADNNLPAIPISPSMCHVAHLHSQDLADNYESFGQDCNLHSWSDQGSWGACCYTPDHAEAQCMWDKPGEITNYPGNGYEISFVTGAMDGGTAQDAVDAWLQSSGHAGVILNQGIWADSDWQAVGGGAVDGYWNVWFGEEVDPGWP